MGCANETSTASANPGAPPSKLIEVTYFGLGYGRVDPIVQMLQHSGANWKFHAETFETWGPRKASGKTAEFGALPIIKIGQREFDLSIPALRSLAMQLGYYPCNDWKNAARVDEVCEVYGDAFNAIAAVLINEGMSMDDKVSTVTKHCSEGGVVYKFLKLTESVLARSTGRFLCGDKVTMADCCLTSFMFNHFKNPNCPLSGHFGPILAREFPKIETYCGALEKEFAKHLTSRPPKPF